MPIYTYKKKTFCAELKLIKKVEIKNAYSLVFLLDHWLASMFWKVRSEGPICDFAFATLNQRLRSIDERVMLSVKI